MKKLISKILTICILSGLLTAIMPQQSVLASNTIGSFQELILQLQSKFLNGNVLAASATVDEDIPKATYCAHVQNIGWMNEVSSPDVAGTTGKGYRLESFILNLMYKGKSMVKYRAHVQNIGWQDWVNSGTAVGTTGRAYRIENLEIKLKDEYAQLYDIYYRVHVSNVGWLGWAKNGESAGSTGIGAAIEAVQVQLVKKGDTSLDSAVASCIEPRLTYKSHVANIGWMSPVHNDTVSGTTGESRRLEAIIATLTDPFGNANIKYRAHVSNVGWQNWVSSGEIMGTTGESKAIESVEFQLTGILAVYYDVYYRVHVSNIGWLGWAKNGACAGTTGGSLPVEAVQVKIVPKGTAVDPGGVAYYEKAPGAESNSSEGNVSGNTWKMPMNNAYCTWRTKETWSWGTYTNNSTNRNYHIGIDIYGTNGTVYAASGGKVVAASSSNSGANGRYIIIQHTISGKTVYSFYAHLSSMNVSVGQTVEKGTKIGVAGGSGYGSNSYYGAHLHFAIVDTLWSNGGYYGYATKFTGNKVDFNGVIYYNPIYIINNNKLP